MSIREYVECAVSTARRQDPSPDIREWIEFDNLIAASHKDILELLLRAEILRVACGHA